MSAAAKPTTRPGRRNYLRQTDEPLDTLLVTLRLTAAERQRLVLEAKTRGLLPTGLSRVLLERIIHGGLFNLVLNCTASQPAFNERTLHERRQEARADR